MSSKSDPPESAKPSSTLSSHTAHAQTPLNSDPSAPHIIDSTTTRGLNTTVLPRPMGLIGMTLDGRYLVESELGHGGIGAVYLARDRKLVNKAVVVKVLLEASLQNEWAVRKFQHEMEALSRVDHPGIIGIIDAGELPDGKPYIVMQYAEGATLRSVMRSEGADLDRTARLMEQIGHALSAAHDKAILHRDLKPDNIMIQKLAGDREQIKIIDFGIAKVRDSQVAPSTALAATVGTVAYMSPEQLRAEPLTTSSDVYSLGIIAYEMVAGRRPFNPKTGYQLLEMQREEVRIKPKDLRPALPEAAQAVILRALAFDPQDRYHSAAEFGEDFAKAISRNNVETPDGFVDRKARTKILPPDRTNHAAAKRPLHPRLIVAAVATLFLVGIVAVTLWLFLKARDAQSQGQTGSSTSAPASERRLSYWLTVQKMRDDKPYQGPFESSGQEIFENGWKFRFNASSPQSGYLYLLNEGPDGKVGTSYNLLYPTPSANNGSAQLAAAQQMQTGWYVFDRNQGTEKFWIVWSSAPVADLEAVKGVVNPQDKGAIKDHGKAEAVRAFLTKGSSPPPEVNKVDKQSVIRSTGDVLVKLVGLEHH